MAERIDELQLQIGSDASDAIRQLGNLATALNIAAASASKLGGASGDLQRFASFRLARYYSFASLVTYKLWAASRS